MKKLKPLLISIYIKIKNITPKKYQNIFEDYFFLYTPIWLLRKVTFAYDGYLMHFKPNKGDVVLDCGAYEGHFSIIASRLVGKKGLVYSFEPQDEMADIMSKKFSKYELSNIRDGSKTVGWVENFLIDQGFKSWTGFTAHLTTYGIKK